MNGTQKRKGQRVLNGQNGQLIIERNVKVRKINVDSNPQINPDSTSKINVRPSLPTARAQLEWQAVRYSHFHLEWSHIAGPSWSPPPGQRAPG